MTGATRLGLQPFEPEQDLRRRLGVCAVDWQLATFTDFSLAMNCAQDRFAGAYVSDAGLRTDDGCAHLGVVINGRRVCACFPNFTAMYGVFLRVVEHPFVALRADAFEPSRRGDPCRVLCDTRWVAAELKAHGLPDLPGSRH